MASDFRDDLFGDDFDDDFDEGGFDDFDEGGGFDDFDEGGFDDAGFDDDFDLGLDDDEDFGDFDEDFQDEFATTEGGGEGGGPSPVFIIIAVVMIILLLGALGLIGYLIIAGPPSQAEQTATAVVATNQAIELQVAQSATQAKVVMDITMTAEAWTDTPTPTSTPTDTPTATEDTSALQTEQAQGTLEAADNLATETAIAATQTLGAQLNPTDILPVASPTPLGGVPGETVLVATISVGETSIGIADVPLIDIDGTPVPLSEGTAIALVDGTPAAVVQSQPLNPNVPVVQGTSVAIINDEPVIVLESLPLSALGIYADIPPETSREVVEATAIAQIDSTPFIVIDSVSVAFGGPTATLTPAGGEAVSLSAVQMTATALAGILIEPTLAPTTIAGGSGGGEATPTREIVLGPDTDGGIEDEFLPDTGLFDDVFGGNPMTIFLAAFGLLGVIVLSRRLRKENRKRK